MHPSIVFCDGIVHDVGGSTGSAPVIVVDSDAAIGDFIDDLKIDSGLDDLAKLKNALTTVSVDEISDVSTDGTVTPASTDRDGKQQAELVSYFEHNAAESKTIAFAFDIDGVLMRGKTPIPGARETVLKLQQNNIPFIFLTNGGGHTEAAHVAQLGSRLSLPDLKPDQFVQSHSPFLDLVDEYKEQTILALGGSGQSIRNLALAYGFKNVVISSDIMAEQESIHPFPEMTKQHHAEHGRSAGFVDRNDASNTQISAILVFSSPRDWCLDLQIVIDLLLSERGVVGTRSSKNGDKSLPNNGYLQDGQPKLFFCNPDFEWATSHAQPRFAQGAFREALEGIWRFATSHGGGGSDGIGGARLEYTICGKPTDKTYVYGERVLQAYNKRLQDEVEQEHKNNTATVYTIGNNDAIAQTTSTTTAAVTGRPSSHREISHVYMIGDNPLSDIIGANSFTSRFGSTWKSILVETGVHVAGTKPAHEPHHIARDVQCAVDWALAQHDRFD
ncbi:HAD-like domain-containing protein [Microdochium bolleyi]|uniref:HAD-like domain-containing protein n=1 Tax=Microdochium bolleyi TaxID=196109 RepID=A0A136J1N8_9PEZI|nr:HAD-like domain-containing protein [Microdochium bolleyi]